MLLSEIMKVHVVSATLESTVAEIIGLMDLYQISHVPIIDSRSTPVGVITVDSIARNLIDGQFKSKLSKLMTDSQFTLDENCSVDEAEKLLQGNQLRRLCVTSDGKLVGTVGWVELCQVRISEQ